MKMDTSKELTLLRIWFLLIIMHMVRWGIFIIGEFWVSKQLLPVTDDLLSDHFRVEHCHGQKAALTQFTAKLLCVGSL